MPDWGQILGDLRPEVTGRLGLSRNEHGVEITVFICDTCHQPFTVTGDINPRTWGRSCLSVECDSYDVDRDVDVMFEIEPWRIQRDDSGKGDL